MSELNFGALKLNFHPVDQRVEKEASFHQTKNSSLAGPLETHSEDADSIDMAISPQDHEAIKGFYEAQRLLEDPISYEEQLIDADLEDSRREDDESTRYRGSE